MSQRPARETSARDGAVNFGRASSEGAPGPEVWPHDANAKELSLTAGRDRRTQVRLSVGSAVVSLCVIATAAGCTSPSAPPAGPLGKDLSENSVCTPARGRTSVSLAEVLVNSSGGQIVVTEIRAINATNLKIDCTGVHSGRTANLPIVSGDPDPTKLDAFSSSARVASKLPFEYLVAGAVIDPKKDVVIHGFTVRYSVGSSSFELKTPSTLTFAAGDCS